MTPRSSPFPYLSFWAFKPAPQRDLDPVLGLRVAVFLQQLSFRIWACCSRSPCCSPGSLRRAALHGSVPGAGAQCCLRPSVGPCVQEPVLTLLGPSPCWPGFCWSQGHICPAGIKGQRPRASKCTCNQKPEPSAKAGEPSEPSKGASPRLQYYSRPSRIPRALEASGSVQLSNQGGPVFAFAPPAGR